jgi:hypothetical protein
MGKADVVYRPEEADIILAVQSRPTEDVLAVYQAHEAGIGSGPSQTYLWRAMARGGLQKGVVAIRKGLGQNRKFQTKDRELAKDRSLIGSANFFCCRLATSFAEQLAQLFSCAYNSRRKSNSIKFLRFISRLPWARISKFWLLRLQGTDIQWFMRFRFGRELASPVH